MQLGSCQKYALSYFVYSIMFGCTLAVKIRGGTGSVETIAESPDPSPDTGPDGPDSNAKSKSDVAQSEWSMKNIVGLVGIVLVLLSLLFSLFYIGKLRRRAAKLKISKIVLSKRPIEPGSPKESIKIRTAPGLPITAVMKINSVEKPVHHVIPVQDDTLGDTSAPVPVPETKGPDGKSTGLPTFEVDAALFDASTFSLIVREGNIPIHFETLKGKTLSKGIPVDAEKGLKRVELGKLQEGNEDRKLEIFYQIDHK